MAKVVQRQERALEDLMAVAPDLNDFKSKKLLFLVTEDWFFCSHRLHLARTARDRGYQIVVATRTMKHAHLITQEGFGLIEIKLSRQSGMPWRELEAMIQLTKIYSKEKPHIVHHVALKPVLYGSIAALFCDIPLVVNAVTGMGYLFSSSSTKARVLRSLIRVFFRMFLNKANCRVILQNPDDRDLLLSASVLPERISIIRGSGVDLNRFHPTPEPAGVTTVVMASRMLWDKGIREFVAAAQLLKNEGLIARFLLVGESDVANPSAVPTRQLQDWHSQGAVEWLGHSENVPTIFSQAHIVCLPSYREGLPKVLLEAAACARPIITTNTPGCREIVQHEKNGFLVPVKDVQALASALKLLILDPELRKRMGQASRELVVQEFSDTKVAEETLKLYNYDAEIKD